MLIKLSPSEMRLCKLIGAMRYATTSDVCAEQIQSDMNPLEIVVDGVIGEYCVSKHLNLHFSLDTDLREWGADLVTYQGKTVDVKSTRAKGGRLNATKSSDKKNYDIYILCELNDEGADIVGWVTRDSFLKPENIAMGKRGEYYAIDRSKLNTTFTGGQS
jgi:hypothetical protein